MIASSRNAASSVDQQLSQVPPTHASVVGGCVRLERLSAGESTDDDWIEASVAYELGDEFQCLLAVAGKRNAHAVAIAVRLSLEHLRIHRVEAFHPLSPREHRGGPTR